MAYDFIIVGAGSSGCVLANRLSADPDIRILLIESGPDDNSLLVHMPRGFGKLLGIGNDRVWDYDVIPSGNLPAETWFKGRTLGGSSSVNGMVYVRGAPEDYDNWERLGCNGWGWNEMGRHFVALEDHMLGPATWRGVGGPLKVSVHPSGDPFTEAMLAGIGQNGTSRVEDINDMPAVTSGGVGYQPLSTFRGRRFSASKAFLAPIRSRENLEIVTSTDVLRILFEGERAVGVRVRDATGMRDVKVEGEILLAAGAIQSPKLLQLSGIGPAKLLSSLGVPVIVDAPDVGRNLREHRTINFSYRIKAGSLNHRLSGVGLAGSVIQYLLTSSGPLSHGAHEAGGFVKTDPSLDRPDAQVGLTLLSFTKDDLGRPVLDPFPGATLISYFLRPESQGTITIQSSNPDTPPNIVANHFSADIDKQHAVSLYRWHRRLGEQPALKPWLQEQLSPPVYDRDDDILSNILAMGGTGFHVSGTCRMGADSGSVVDPELRVRGVQGLRVIDTSIMPELVSGNTNAPAMAIAMNAAEIILRHTYKERV